ncbi:MAG: GumC family protein, partial [Gammaproteobacteria bacterium]
MLVPSDKDLSHQPSLVDLGAHPRAFTTAYKLQVLEEIEDSPEEEEAILRREGLMRSQIKYWRRQRARGELDDLNHPNLTPHLRGHQALGHSPSFMPLAFRDSALRIAESAPVRQLFETIWRAKWTVFSTVAVLTTLTVIALLKITPLYSGQALIMLESAQNVQGIDAETAMAGDPQTIETEMEVMRSRRLADRITDQFKLATIEEFNPALQPTSAMSRLSTFVNSLFRPPVSEALNESDRLAENRAVIINELLNNIQLSQQGKSRIISLEVQSKNPVLAAQIANALAEGYIADQLGAKFRRIRRTNAWLNERIAVLRRNVGEAETEIENFRNNSDLLDGELHGQQISQLNAELVGAQAGRSESEARLREAKNSVETLDSPLIRTLNERAAELDREIAERSMEYGLAHPSMVNLQAQKKDLVDQIASESSRNLAGLKNAVRIAQSREAA